MSQHNRIYDDLAYLWPLISPLEDYAEEAAYWRELLREKLGPGRCEILELGVGGGHNLSYLTKHYKATAVDLSAKMLAFSQQLNPDVEHHVGDMRSVRLAKQFDAVIVHDAIAYMICEDDLRRTFATAAAHLKPGGVCIVTPDYVKETFVDATVHHRTVKQGDLELTRLEYEYDPDPDDTSYEVLFFLLIRENNGAPKIEQDRHTLGLFPVSTWKRLLSEAGFNVEVRRKALVGDDELYQIHFFIGELRND
ncbi:MAG TPA: class I SAM-dependent methyltransferase [bacterium]|nr:class I SAM-dependent methyltransferase [bacterium]